MRGELLGMRGHALRRCLPVPSDTETDGDVERVVYRWTLAAGEGGRTAKVYQPYEIVPSRRRIQRETGDFLLEGQPPEHQPFCQLTFELREGLIRDVQALGRDGEGLNADSLCLMYARPCLPQPAPESPASPGETPGRVPG